jgi:predicted TIM-barrel fold metal-dependent hydrolase
MINAYDCDSHVWEGDHTFSDKYWDQRYRGRRPLVVESDVQGNLSFMVDSLSFPRITGPGPVLGGNPVSKQGVPSEQFVRSRAVAAEKGHLDTLASCELHTASDRVEQMDREHIAMQVNFPSLSLHWPYAQDPKIGCAMARAYNRWMADVSSEAPNRLKWVTLIDPADVDEAVREIQRSKEMGSAGLMLLGSYGKRHLDDPAFELIWATAAELDMPVAIHVGFSNEGLDEQYFTIFDSITIPFSFNLMLGFHAVMRSGLLDRYPKLRIGFMENGARWVDFLAKRIAENCGKLERTTTTGRRPVANESEVAGSSAYHRLTSAYRSEFVPEEYIRRGQVYVNCEVDEEQLPFVVQEYGDDFLMFAADIPHGHRVIDPISKFLERDDLGQVTKRKILVDNTARFYGLPVPQAAPELAAAGD